MEWDLLDRLAFYIPLLLSLTVHEWAHAWTAWKLGDDTARMLGRVSLNPVDHIDPIGTLLLPLIGIPFGWAKPVPINPVRFRPSVNMSLGVLLTAAAGPVSNLLIAVGCTVVLAALNPLSSFMNVHTQSAMTELLYYVVTVNVMLALFNMIPIPPLDGSRIADSLMPARWQKWWAGFCALGPVLLVGVLLLPFFGVRIFEVPMTTVYSLLDYITTG